MTQENKIQEALSMIKYNNFSWRMCEWGYVKEYDKAKARMRRFVAHVSTIENAAIRTALRNLWTLRCKEAQEFIDGKRPDYTEQKNEYMAIIAS